MATIYLPFYIKKNESNKNKYELIEDENSFLLRYINNLKSTKSINLIWVGMLKNYFDFIEDEINEIDEFLYNKGYSMIRPNKKDWQLFLFYIERIMFPIFYNSSVCPNDECLADNKQYYDAFYNISKNFLNAISVNYQDNDFVVLQNIGLCFVPNLLINKKENTHIGLYIHSTLPSSDIVKIFPNYSEIFKSILLCDVIGFHDFTAARNFLTIMKRFLGIFNEITKKGIISLSYLGRNIIIHIKQPQLDYDFIKKLTENEEFKNYDKKYEKKFENNELTVISFDYLFTLTAIFNKLKAIDLFLESHKELIDKCNFIMWIKGFKQNLDNDFEEEEEKDNDKEEEEEEEEDDDEEEKEEEDEDDGKKHHKKKKKIKIKRKLSKKQNNKK
jgi:trehalose 6-phosphate synthase/phosphatase